ncbi:hypothetical protein [Rheinheimera faecalis]|jgi:uncharacterized protein YqhQ|uniref:hypothetical protein n=1 Tax=Rheinheimera faecalis TaxID=2901141 RepID=UPI001E4759F6|nr:hypothetical protein [Rheinheimera faecalis]
MASADYVFGNKQWEINRWILVLSTLGLVSKILEIDLSQISIFGLNLQGKEAALVPGFIGLALAYALLTFVVARMELILAHNDETEAHVTSKVKKIGKSKVLLFLLILSFLIPMLVYVVIPVGLALFTLFLLYDDMYAVIQVIWGAV